MNIVSEIRAQQHGERIAICGEGGELTFASLFEAVDEIRERVQRLPCFGNGGVPRIGVVFPNGAGYIAVALAVLDAGACFVPVPDELTPTEREALIAETALDAVICASDSGFALPLGLGMAAVNEVVPVDCKFPVEEFEALNPAFIRFSSGTTGSSKGVVLSHESLLERIQTANGGLRLRAGDRVLWTLPMAHHFAVTIILYLYHGVTTVMETSHRPERLVRAARESEANLLYGGPFHFAQLAQCDEGAPLPHLRMAISTASALGADVARAFERRFDLPITQALGIIEVGLPLLNTARSKDLPTALGQPLPGYEVKASPSGELLIKGPGMFDAYLSPWQPRAEILSDGWFATGDLVEIQDDGTVILLGRSKSVINVGGMKVFPEKHAALGFYPSAEVIVREGCRLPTMIELRSHCRDRLAAYKIPMRLAAVNSIALTASGKVKRH